MGVVCFVVHGSHFFTILSIILFPLIVISSYYLELYFIKNANLSRLNFSIYIVYLD